jgi:hypothetical protein
MFSGRPAAKREAPVTVDIEHINFYCEPATRTLIRYISGQQEA